MSEITKKKRGRKPKNFNILPKSDVKITEESINTEDEKIIFHLPITIDEINNNYNQDNSLFIKSEKDIKNISDKLSLQKIKSSEESDSTETLKSSAMNVSCNKFLFSNIATFAT